MRFDNSRVRRRDRLLNEERAMELLAAGEYGVLSLAGNAEGGVAGYGVPLNYVLSGYTIYFHCAPEGRKLTHIDEYPEGSFCVVGRTEVEPGKFSTGYESVIASGRLSLVADDGERMDALKLLLKKYSPRFYETGIKYSQKSFARVAILKMDISLITGKTKNIWHNG